ncbi:MAG: DNRLRE domain-containing protein [Candidatus Aenigmatarchaeota archaeon]
MKKVKKELIFLIFLIFILQIQNVNARRDIYAEGRFNVSEDTYVNSNYPNNNYGTSQDLYVRSSSPTQITYLKFNGSIPDNMTIVNSEYIELNFYVSSLSSYLTIYAHRLFDPFYENETTYNSKPSASDPFASIYTNDPGWKKINMSKNDFINSLNNGIQLTSNSATTSVVINSKENSNNNLAWLNITYYTNYLEINAYDEINQSKINSFNVYINNETDSVMYLNLTSTENKIDYSRIPLGNITIGIEDYDGNYARRNYVINWQNRSQNYVLNAYLPRVNRGWIHSIYVTNLVGYPITNATVQFYKLIGSSFVELSNDKTDSGGIVNNFVDAYTLYYVSVSADNYNPIFFGLAPNPQYRVTQVRLFSNETIISISNFTSPFSNVYYLLLPENRTHYNNITFSFELIDTDNNLNYWGMYVYYANKSNLIYNYTSYTPSGGIIEYTTGNNTGKYIVVPFFKKGSYPEYSFERFYWLNRKIGISNLEFGWLSDFSKLLIAIIITIVIMAFVGRINQTGAAIVGLIVLGFFMLIGFIDWLVLLATCLVVISLLFLRIYI